MAQPKATSLSELIGEAERHVDANEPISLALLQRIAGQRAAGPLLLGPALLAMSPLTIIPGVPSLIGLSTVLVASQVAIGRDRIWLPGWLKRLKLSTRHAKRLLKFLKPIGRKADAVVKPRATFVTSWPLRRLGALVCAAIGLAMPMMEVIPFTSTWAGVVIAGYGLSITARDGFLALALTALVAAIGLAALTFIF